MFAKSGLLPAVCAVHQQVLAANSQAYIETCREKTKSCVALQKAKGRACESSGLLNSSPDSVFTAAVPSASLWGFQWNADADVTL
jgi:hypothetical protein